MFVSPKTPPASSHLDADHRRSTEGTGRGRRRLPRQPVATCGRYASGRRLTGPRQAGRNAIGTGRWPRRQDQPERPIVGPSTRCGRDEGRGGQGSPAEVLEGRDPRTVDRSRMPITFDFPEESGAESRTPGRMPGTAFRRDQHVIWFTFGIRFTFGMRLVNGLPCVSRRLTVDVRHFRCAQARGPYANRCLRLSQRWGWKVYIGSSVSHPASVKRGRSDDYRCRSQ